MTSKKPASSKRATPPKACDYTKTFFKDWERLSHSGRYDLNRLKEAMLLLIGMFYLSIGCLASALTRNQIVAAVMSFSVITLLFFTGLLSFFVLNITPTLREMTAYFSSLEHMGEASRGFFDSRPVVFYLSLTLFVLFLTFHVFQSRRWRN